MADDVSSLLTRRISRRQFLFGDRRSGDLGAPAMVVGGAGAGLAVMGLVMPGPSASGFQDAYVRKSPTITQEILSTLVTPFRLKRSDNSTLWEWNGVTQRVQVGNIEAESPSFFQVGDVASGQELFPFAYSGGGKTWLFGDLETVDPANSKGVEFRANSSAFGGSSHSFTATSDQGSGAASALFGSGASVGQPTGTLGPLPNTLCAGGHRHAFSGRFGIGPGYIRDASLGGATPAKFMRLISNNNWTLRRLSVFALTAPGGTGSDTYGVVNAAGTLQGTAVSLAVGATENATALQVTNLTGGTVYYFAVTARATTPALDVTLVPEYTMNV